MKNKLKEKRSSLGVRVRNLKLENNYAYKFVLQLKVVMYSFQKLVCIYFLHNIRI